MDAYDRCTNLGKKIFPMLLPPKVETENFSDHPRTRCRNCEKTVMFVKT